MHHFPEGFQCIPQCLKKFPQKYIFKAFDTVVFVVYLVLHKGRGLGPLPLVSLVSRSRWATPPDTPTPIRADTRVPGMTGSSLGVKSQITVRAHVAGLVLADHPAVLGEGVGRRMEGAVCGF